MGVLVHDPNSRLGRFRIWLASWLDPHPDPGEAWCMGCSFNEGRTLVLSLSGVPAHRSRHRAAEGDQKYLRMRENWPPSPEPPA